MGWQYNENLYEGLAVLAVMPSTAVTTTGATCGPFNTKTLRRVIFDINVSSAASTNAGTCTVTLQTNTTSAATGFTNITTCTSYTTGGVYGPVYINSTTNGYISATYAAAGTWTSASSTTAGTTGPQFYRLEYKVESIRAALDQATGSGPSSTSNTSTWLQLYITNAATNQTVTMSAVAYGVLSSYPSADIVLNQFTPATTTASGATTSIPVAFAQQTFIDGYGVNNIPYSTTVLGSMSKNLPA